MQNMVYLILVLEIRILTATIFFLVVAPVSIKVYPGKYDMKTSLPLGKKNGCFWNTAGF